MSHRSLLGNLLAGLGSQGLGDSVARFCEAVASGNGTAIATVLAGLSGGPLLGVGVLAGGLALQLSGDRRRDEATQKQFGQLGEQIRAAGDDTDRLAGLLLPFVDREDHFLTRLPGYEKAELAGLLAEQIRETLIPLLPDGSERIDWDDVRIFLNVHDDVLRDLYSIAMETLDVSKATLAGVERMEKAYFSGRVALPGIPAGVTNNLTQAFVQRNPDFVGRKQLLSDLHAALTRGENAALTHALSAEGGVGKTEIAAEYVHDPQYTSQWEGIWWLDASEEGVERSLDLLLATMGYPQRQGDDPVHRRVELVRRLGAGRHLLVLDNLDSVDTLRSFCFASTTRVLATTRLSSRALPAALATTIDVDLLAPEDGARLLVRHRPDLRDSTTDLPTSEAQKSIDAIVQYLDRHALALGYAASKLRSDNGISPEKLLALLRRAEIDSNGHVFSKMGEDETGRRYGRKVAASLLLHLPDLEAENSFVAPLMLALATSHSPSVPFSVLASCFEHNSESVRFTLFKLSDVSLIRFDTGKSKADGGVVFMHRLTQSALRARAGKDVAQDMKQRMNKAWISWLDSNGVLKRMHESGPVPDKESFAVKLKILGDSLLQNGQQEDAGGVYWQALQMRRRLFGKDHSDIATSLNDLATVMCSLDRASEAEVLYQESLGMRRRLSPDDHPDIVSSLNNLGYINGVLGRWHIAVDYHEQAVAMGKRCPSAADTHLAILERNLTHARRQLKG